MKNQKAVRILSMAIFVVALVLGTAMILFSYTDAGCMDCVEIFRDEEVIDNVSVFESEEDICQVDIKAATTVYIFTEDGCKSGYCVSGIGTKSGVATVETGFEHDISHISWYVYDDPTPVKVMSFSPLRFISRLINSIKSLF